MGNNGRPSVRGVSFTPFYGNLKPQVKWYLRISIIIVLLITGKYVTFDITIIMSGLFCLAYMKMDEYKRDNFIRPAIKMIYDNMHR